MHQLCNLRHRDMDKHMLSTRCRPPSPLPLRVAKAGKNHLNEEITFPPSLWDRRAIQPNHIEFRTCSALVPM
jgi:hypothetical protein